MSIYIYTHDRLWLHNYCNINMYIYNVHDMIICTVYIYIYLYDPLCIYYVCMYIYIYIHVYIYIYTCMYVYIYIYKYTYWGIRLSLCCFRFWSEKVCHRPHISTYQGWVTIYISITPGVHAQVISIRLPLEL